MITIIIPAYNCQDTLNKTLSSLEAQTDYNFKVIIVDDNSNIPINSYIKKYPFDVNVIRKNINEGCGMSRQTGIDNVNTEYFTFLDSDDMLMPYAIQVINSTIKYNPEYDIIHSVFIEEKNKEEYSTFAIIKDGFTWCHGKVYKKSFIDKFNIRNIKEVYYNEDGYFNSICTELGNIGMISIPIYLWVYNKKSITRDTNSNFHKTQVSSFIKGIRKSLEFVLQYKKIEEVIHIKNTFNIIKQDIEKLNKEDSDYKPAKKEFNKLKKLLK